MISEPSNQFSKWEPISGIDSPCADLSFNYQGSDDLTVTMYFTRVKNGIPRDLVIKFHGVISVRWMDECCSMIAVRLQPPPVLEGRFSGWTFPLLQSDSTAYLAEYQKGNPPLAKGRKHFYLVCMNDLLDVLALPDVEATWVEGSK